MATPTTSAGGILVRQTAKGGKEVLLGYTKYPEERWALPKGIVKEGETPEAAAIREVQEETGYTGKILRELGRVQFSFTHRGTEYDKTVIYYEMGAGGEPGARDTELKEIRWISREEAVKLIPFENEREILRKI